MFCHNVTDIQFGSVSNHGGFSTMGLLVTTEAGSVEINLFSNSDDHEEVLQRLSRELETEACATWTSSPYSNIAISFHDIVSAKVEWEKAGEVKVMIETSFQIEYLYIYANDNV